MSNIKRKKKKIAKWEEKKKIEMLFKVLNDPDYKVCKIAIQALGRIGDLRAVEPLINILIDENRGGERRAAAEALGMLGDKKAVEPLIKVFISSRGYQRQIAAAIALGELGDKRAIEPLVKSLVTCEIGSNRIEIAKVLKMLGDKKWDGMINGDRHDYVRLGETKDKRFVMPLIERLTNHRRFDDKIIAIAIETLGLLGDKRAVDVLISIINSNRSRLHCEVVTALGEIGDAKAVDSIIKVLESGNFDIRGAAATALGKIGDKKAVSKLIKATKDNNYVCEKAIKALGEMGDKKAAGSLIILLCHDDADIRKYAAQALSNLGDPQWSKIVHGFNDDFNKLAETNDERILKALIQSFRIGESDTRELAAKALGKSGDGSAVEPLIKALQCKDWRTKHAAAQGLIDIAKKQNNMDLIDKDTMTKIQNMHTDMWTNEASLICYSQKVREHTDQAIDLKELDF